MRRFFAFFGFNGCKSGCYINACKFEMLLLLLSLVLEELTCLVHRTEFPISLELLLQSSAIQTRGSRSRGIVSDDLSL
jgi:hypothetical protein